MNEADGVFLHRRGCKHLLHMLEQNGNLPVMLGQLPGKLLVGRQNRRILTKVRMIVTFTSAARAVFSTLESIATTRLLRR